MTAVCCLPCSSSSSSASSGSRAAAAAAELRKAKIRKFAGQDYARLKASATKERRLYVDDRFPPSNPSLFLDNARSTSSGIVWKRPADLASEPRLFVEGAAANDVKQGILGNCWFVSACSALTHNAALLNQVIPDGDEQEWNASKPYAGIFRFRFWRFGEWVEVVVDDLLPTRDGKLLFARSNTPNEFWSALLEKAFAKLYGCYENLVGGQLADALQDVSGGVAETIHVQKYLAAEGDAAAKSNGVRVATPAVTRLFDMLRGAFDNEALIVAAIAARSVHEVETSLECGLVKGHAYAVTAVRTIELDATKTSSSVMMLRLQNPWGEKEWNGAWSDDSKEWEQVTAEQKQRLGISVDEDGEFWMHADDFARHFTDISLCQLFNTHATTNRGKRYREFITRGVWSTNGARPGAPADRAGGCLNFAATACSNPQFVFDVLATDVPTEVMFALTQADTSEGCRQREPLVTIGMHLMRVERNRRHRVHQPTDGVATSDYANARSVFLHVRNLTPGRYVLLPTTYAPKEQSSFLLRIYSDARLAISSLEKHAPSRGLVSSLKSCFVRRGAGGVTRIRLNSVDLLTREQNLTVYAIVSPKVGARKSGEKCRTSTAAAAANREAKWGEAFVFHCNAPRQVYTVELWEDRRLARDRLLGKTELIVLVDNDQRSGIRVDIADAAARSTRPSPIAVLTIDTAAYDDAMYL